MIETVTKVPSQPAAEALWEAVVQSYRQAWAMRLQDSGGERRGETESNLAKSILDWSEGVPADGHTKAFLLETMFRTEDHRMADALTLQATFQKKLQAAQAEWLESLDRRIGQEVRRAVESMPRPVPTPRLVPTAETPVSAIVPKSIPAPRRRERPAVGDIPSIIDLLLAEQQRTASPACAA